MFYNFSKFLVFLFFKTFYRLRVRGEGNIPSRGSFIIAGNHVSFLDPPVVGVSVRRPLWFLARRELFRFPLFGSILRLVHSVPLGRDKLDFRTLKTVLALAKRNRPFVIFPEGTRSRDGSLQAGKPGAGLFAWKTKLPVIPVYVSGTARALPYDGKFLRPSRIEVTFGQVIDLGEHYGRKPGREVFTRISGIMMEEIARIKDAADHTFQT